MFIRTERVAYLIVPYLGISKCNGDLETVMKEGKDKLSQQQGILGGIGLHLISGRAKGDCGTKLTKLCKPITLMMSSELL